MIFESHAHYESEQFDEDRESLLASFKENNIGCVVNVASNLAATKASLELADKYPWIYASVGVHPSDVAELSEEGLKWLYEMCAHEKCVAVGEIGLDYYWDKEADIQEKQRFWFRKQIQMAKDKQLPIIVHSRDAAKDTMDIIKDTDAASTGGVIHCFSNSLEFAKLYVDMGFYIGIGGVVTFKNAKTLKEVAAWTPLERILLETDCPYLAPVPNRGKRNSSLNLIYVARTIAELKGISVDEVIEQTWENAMRMYRIEG